MRAAVGAWRRLGRPREEIELLSADLRRDAGQGHLAHALILARGGDGDGDGDGDGRGTGGGGGGAWTLHVLLRGSAEVADVVSDLDIAAAVLGGGSSGARGPLRGHVHGGVWRAAVETCAVVTGVLEDRYGRRGPLAGVAGVVVSGHSLGGGAAAVVGYLLHEWLAGRGSSSGGRGGGGGGSSSGSGGGGGSGRGGRGGGSGGGGGGGGGVSVRAVCIGAPPVADAAWRAHAAAREGLSITSLVRASDIVPRLSIHSLRAFADRYASPPPPPPPPSRPSRRVGSGSGGGGGRNGGGGGGDDGGGGGDAAAAVVDAAVASVARFVGGLLEDEAGLEHLSAAWDELTGARPAHAGGESGQVGSGGEAASDGGPRMHLPGDVFGVTPTGGLYALRAEGPELGAIVPSPRMLSDHAADAYVSALAAACGGAPGEV